MAPYSIANENIMTNNARYHQYSVAILMLLWYSMVNRSSWTVLAFLENSIVMALSTDCAATEMTAIITDNTAEAETVDRNIFLLAFPNMSK
jgi:hypothetical protein